MARPASPIFKSLWENFSGGSSDLFIFNRLISAKNPLLGAAGERQGCVNWPKDSRADVRFLFAKIYSTLG